MKVFLLVLISLALAAKWQDDVLEIFNTQRHGYGLAPLQWEAVLEASALKSSQRCFVSLDVTSGHGEIVVRGFGVAEADAPKLMAALLVAEGQDWNCSADLCISGGCQHNRQIIWETTTQVGCGMTNCGSKGYELVCHFAPVGNIVKTHPLIKGPKSCPVPPQTNKRTFGGYFQACSSICQGLISACLGGWNSGGSSWGGGWSAPPGGSGWSTSWGSSGKWGGSGGWRLTQTENDATVLSYNALWAWWNKDGRSVMVDAGFDAEADGTVHPIPGQGFKGLDWTDEVLEIHNAERASFGVKPLKWDTALAAGAKTYSQACTLKPSLTRGLGESLAIGKGVDSRNAPKMLAAIWANEIFDWNCTTDKCSSGLCSHHRQMVWAETTKVGCGFAPCSDGFALVCRYDVAGNVGSRHPLESLGPKRCEEQPGFSALKKTREVTTWGSWGGGAGNLLSACLSGYGLFSTSSWGGSTGGWSGSSGGSGWGSSGQGWGNSGWSSSGSSGWNSQKSGGYAGFRWGGDSESSSWGGGGASVCGSSKSGWKRSWGSSSSAGWNSGSSSCGSSKSGWGKRSWGSSGCESSGWGSSGSLSWGASTPDCGGWTNGQQGWGGGRAGWGSSSSGGNWRVEGSVGAQSFHIKMGSETVQTRNPVLEWYNVDGRSARVDPGVETKEDGTVVALADSEVSGTHYIGALPRNTAIVVIVVCCFVGFLLVALIVAFVIKKRKRSYVDTV